MYLTRQKVKTSYLLKTKKSTFYILYFVSLITFSKLPAKTTFSIIKEIKVWLNIKARINVKCDYFLKFNEMKYVYNQISFKVKTYESSSKFAELRTLYALLRCLFFIHIDLLCF